MENLYHYCLRVFSKQLKKTKRFAYTKINNYIESTFKEFGEKGDSGALNRRTSDIQRQAKAKIESFLSCNKNISSSITKEETIEESASFGIPS